MSLGAGVIRTSLELNIPDFVVGTPEEIISSLKVLDPTECRANVLGSCFRENLNFHFPLADLVALTCAMLCSLFLSPPKISQVRISVHRIHYHCHSHHFVTPNLVWAFQT